MKKLAPADDLAAAGDERASESSFPDEAAPRFVQQRGTLATASWSFGLRSLQQLLRPACTQVTGRCESRICRTDIGDYAIGDHAGGTSRPAAPILGVVPSR
ncbi:MAG: hypothetical protein F4Y60_04855 [Boseongicola sp. SB0664_bin_43]|uniref:Uncharacterized protein n=1 Tax=Boseongicola sp. SB0664_bin_43 TaxID=2604844 RepID=A0A6B0Y014_9RHOB|nr:hypothetical protein [Boseongicola sp. SB0664_bin_43]